MKENKCTSGYRFSDPELEQLAYTHPSCRAERGDNQRLEFLGDAVLDLIIADLLYRKLPDQDEGVLDRARASIVNGQSLAAKASELGLGSRILVSESQQRHHREPSKAMLEDALEALIGAVYLDGGLEPARDFVLRVFADQLDAIRPEEERRNAKSLLQEWAQAHKNGVIPSYELIRSEGPDHQKHFCARVLLNDVELGQGEGTSIKSAESAAAEMALENLNRDG
jgi:ribonuclease-3